MSRDVIKKIKITNYDSLGHENLKLSFHVLKSLELPEKSYFCKTTASGIRRQKLCQMITPTETILEIKILNYYIFYL